MMRSKKRIGLVLSLVWGLTATGHAEGSWYPDTAPQLRQERTTAANNLPQSRVQPPDIHMLSEAFGHFIGKEMRDQGIELDIKDVVAGLEAGVQGKAPPLNEAEYEAMIGHYRDRGFQERSKANLFLANAFLKSNARNEGVRELVPGKLQYKVLKAGRGPVVANNSAPLVHYTGQFIDGTVFGGTDAKRAQ